MIKITSLDITFGYDTLDGKKSMLIIKRFKKQSYTPFFACCIIEYLEEVQEQEEPFFMYYERIRLSKN